MSAQPATIEATGLSKYYGRFAAIEDVSFAIGAGRVTAFLGPNGAGKTTTMKILTGYLAPSAGNARLMGFDIGEDRLAASAHLGYLPEHGPLYPEMTPLAFLSYVGGLRALRGAALRAALDRVCEDCGLEEVWRRPIGKLSKGFRQRVGLAQALLHDPEILILDEPTSGLDPNQIRIVRALITRLAVEKTILLSTHILREVEALADRVLVIADGQLRFDGALTDLCAEDDIEARFHALTGGVSQ